MTNTSGVPGSGSDPRWTDPTPEEVVPGGALEPDLGAFPDRWLDGDHEIEVGDRVEAGTRVYRRARADCASTVTW